jgi:hypothetical protein
MRVLATLFVAQRCYSTFLRAGQSLDDSHMRPRPSHPPFADGLAHGLGGFGADCWQEANEILRPAILCPSRLKGVPKEIERDVLESLCEHSGFWGPTAPRASRGDAYSPCLSDCI